LYVYIIYLYKYDIDIISFNNYYEQFIIYLMNISNIT